MKAVELSATELQSILKTISINNKQGIRLVEYLAKHPDSITVDVNQSGALGNISDVVRKLNPTIFKHGFFISCRRPPVPVKNRFNDDTSQFLWGIYRLVNSGQPANDPEVNDKAS